MNKKLRGLIPSLLIASSTLFSTGAAAKIPPVAFKGITRFFKIKAYSPTLGEAALESGQIHDLRFFGNFKSGESENGKRDFIKDISNDPTWMLGKLLFPSPAGHLVTETSAASNFGRYIRDPKAVALLLNYAKDVRFKKNKDDSALAALLNQIGSQEETKLQHEIKTTLSRFVKENKTLWDTKTPTQKREAKTTLEKNLFSELQKLSLNDNTLKTLVPLIVKTFQKDQNANVMAMFDQDIFKSKYNASKLVLETIQKSIQHESKSIYPTFYSEVLITAFFDDRFNTQTDIINLVAALDGDIVDKNMPLPSQENLLKEEDFKELKNKKVYDLDDLFDLSMRALFLSSIPYKSGVPPLSNGATRQYDRKQNQLLDRIFGDCMEITARHVMAMQLYDPLRRSYDLSSLEIHVKTNSPQNPYFDNFKTFFTNHPPSLANAGDLGIRSAWNTVVGDLNDANEPNSSKLIDYVLRNNELVSGYHNFVKVFQNIFSLNLPNFPAEKRLSEQRKWLEESFVKIFQLVNPNRSYICNFKELKATDKDFAGSLDVTASNKQEKLFSFQFVVMPHHAYIQEITDFLQIPDKIDVSQQEEVDSTTAEDVIHLISKTRQVKQPYYKLIQEPLMDSDSRIRVLERLYSLYGTESEGLFSKDNRSALKAMLEHVLEEIAWEDFEIRDKASPVVLKLINFTELKDIFLEKVKGLKISDNLDLLPEFKNLEFLSFGTAIEEIKGLDKLTKLITLHLAGTEKLKRLPFTTVNTTLEELNLNRSYINELPELSLLQGLKKLDVGGMPNIRSLTFTSKNESLEEVSFNGSHLREIHGIEHLKNLRKIDTKNILNLKNISFSSANSLIEELNFRNSTVEEIQGLEHLSNLRTFSLSQTKNINKLTFSGANITLQEILLYSSNVSEINGLDQLTNLKKLDARSTRNLKTLTFSSANAELEELDIGGSAIQELKGIDSLKKLKHIKSTSLTSLPFNSTNTSLEVLNLMMSDITDLKGLHHLRALKKLNLSYTENLDSIIFSSANAALEDINLSGSNVSKIENLSHLKNLKTVNLENSSNLLEISVPKRVILHGVSPNTKVHRLDDE